MQKDFMNYGTLYNLDCMSAIKQQPNESVDCVITSPPYWQLRDYGYPEQWGLEPTYKQYLAHLQELMTEIWRVLKSEGTVWVNLGDSFNTNQAGTTKFGNGVGANKHYQDFKSIPKKRAKADMPDKCLMLIPHRFAIDCIDNGWVLRNDIIWAKPNGMPESVTDRFSKKHEFIFLFVKQQKYYFDLDSVREKPVSSNYVNNKKESQNTINGQNQQARGVNNINGKNCGDVADFWEIPTKPSSNEHYASYNLDLMKKPILAGCPENGIIYDPFMGSGTTAIAAIHYNRKFIGSEMSKQYFDMSVKNIQKKILSTPERMF